MLKGSYAVLILGAVDSPLAQPPAFVGGHFSGALTGICITKLFHLLPTEERFRKSALARWITVMATSVVVMHITGMTHPPAGRTSLDFNVI